MKRTALAAAASFVAIGLAVTPASALSIVLDYSNDTGYFSANPTARATIQKAASDISAFITTTLATSDMNTGTNGSTVATFDHSLSYTNPSTGVQTSGANAAIAQDQFRIYVGRQNLAGATLAQGGPGGYGFGLSGTGQASQFQGAITNAASASTVNLSRGGGPTIGTLAGTTSGYAYSVSYGALLGNLWFDSDTNNDGIADTDAQVNAYFQTDFAQPVGAGKIDLYSVALHEMLHSIGFGTSQSWTANLGGDGNDWTGANVEAILGTGNNNAVSSDLGHINGSFSSTVLGTNVAQLPVMVPSIGTNERRYLTNLDAAFLKDINWSVASAVPEPTTLAIFAGWAIGAARSRRRASA